MNRKAEVGGGLILFSLLFGIMLIVVVSIFGGLAMFFGSVYDSRFEEAEGLYQNVAYCVKSGKFFADADGADFYKNCRLSSEFFNDTALVKVSTVDGKEWVFGVADYETQSLLNGKNLPKRVVGNVEYSGVEYEILVASNHFSKRILA